MTKTATLPKITLKPSEADEWREQIELAKKLVADMRPRLTYFLEIIAFVYDDEGDGTDNTLSGSLRDAGFGSGGII